MGKICLFAASIEDYVELVVSDFSHDAVILDTAGLEHDQAQTCLARSESLSINNSDLLEEFRSVASSHSDLSHVGDIEKSTARSAVQMFLKASKGVLNWHAVASEVNHLGAHLLLVESPELGASWGCR